MRIGIIGAGNIGGTLARLFVRADHDVALSNSRGPATLGALVAEIGEGVQAMRAANAAAFGEIVVVAIPFGRYREVPAAPLHGKIVVDANNYFEGRDGRIEDIEAGRTTSSELLQRHASGATVVKAFGAIGWARLLNDGRPAGGADRLAIPIAGDDPAAKATVASLIDAIGFDAVDAGPLADGGRKFQPGTDLFTTGLPTADVEARFSA